MSHNLYFFVALFIANKFEFKTRGKQGGVAALYITERRRGRIEDRSLRADRVAKKTRLVESEIIEDAVQ